MTKKKSSPIEAPDPRRQRLLEAAMATFLRYGFRKTSLEEVARAAHISRQGLYLQFQTKEELFSAAARHLLDSCLVAASDALSRGKTLEEKLVGAFDEWAGRYAGVLGGELYLDLVTASEHILGGLIQEKEEQFISLIANALHSSEVMAGCRDKGISERELAETLGATASGLKHQARSREEFGRRFRIAARVYCTHSS